MRRRQPETFATFADLLDANECQAERSRRARRPLALRLLTWGQSRNPYLNALLKLEYFLMLPLRLALALLLAPFAIHNRPLGATVGFLAIFGFWEVFNGFFKEPFLQVNNIEEQICVWLRYARDNDAKEGSSMGHLMACKAQALGSTLSFFWQNLGSPLFREGPEQAAIGFDQAFDQEQKKSWAAASIYADHIVGTSITHTFGDFMQKEPTQAEAPRLTWAPVPSDERLGELRALKPVDKPGPITSRVYLFDLNDPDDERAIKQGYEKRIGHSWRSLFSDDRIEIQLKWPKPVDAPAELRYVLSDLDKKPVDGYVAHAKFSNFGAVDAEMQHVYLIRLHDGRVGVGMYIENNTYRLD